MDEELKARVIRVDDFVAELIEEEAARMPPSVHEQAEAMRGWATRLRASGTTKLVRIWEPADKPQSRLISTDGIELPVTLADYGFDTSSENLRILLILTESGRATATEDFLRNLQGLELERNKMASSIEAVAFNNPHARVKQLCLRIADKEVIFQPFEFEFRPDRLIFRKQN